MDKKEIQPGDRIIMTVRGHVFGYAFLEIFTIADIDGVAPTPEGCTRYSFRTTCGREVYTWDDEFEIIEQSRFIPRQDDKIIITRRDCTMFGQTVSVLYNNAHHVYININMNDSPMDFPHDAYETIRQASPDVSPVALCTDCGGTGKVVLLTSTVDCECRR